MASEVETSAARIAQKLRTTTSSEVERRPLKSGMGVLPKVAAPPHRSFGGAGLLTTPSLASDATGSLVVERRLDDRLAAKSGRGHLGLSGRGQPGRLSYRGRR